MSVGRVGLFFAAEIREFFGFLPSDISRTFNPLAPKSNSSKSLKHLADPKTFLYRSLTSGDIPENNPRECHFLPKRARNKNCLNFLSNFQHYFRNVLQHLTEVFRPYDPCKKSLEIDSQSPKKKFWIFAFFSRF